MTATCEQVARDARKPGDVTKTKRTTGWDIRPFDMADGRRMAFLHVVEGKRREHYRVVWEQQDDMVTVLNVSKELPDGGFGGGYTVTLTNPGVSGGCSCTCLGWHYAGRCKHVGACVTLLSRLLG